MAESTLSNWVSSTKKSWGTLLKSAVWLSMVIGSFLLPPPIGSSGDNKIWLNLGKVVLAVVAGLFFVASQKWNKRPHLTIWWGASAVLLLASLLSVLAYNWLSMALTCRYAEQTLVIGTAYTPQALKDLNENPGISCETLLADFVGKAEDVWTKASIDKARIELAASYLACLPLFAVAIMAMVQSVQILNSKRR